jgi:hypothetical protein
MASRSLVGSVLPACVRVEKQSIRTSAAVTEGFIQGS